ncbi:hypothetical protein D3C87_2098300 [compost metagenome]
MSLVRMRAAWLESSPIMITALPLPPSILQISWVCSVPDSCSFDATKACFSGRVSTLTGSRLT